MVILAAGLAGCASSTLTLQDLRSATKLTLNPGAPSEQVIEGEELAVYLESFCVDKSRLGGASHNAMPGTIEIEGTTYSLLYAEESVTPHSDIIWVVAGSQTIRIRQMLTPR